MTIALVTDSTADIPDNLVEKFQIHVVPNVLVIDGKSVLDGKEISREEYYNRLPQMNTLPTTATASSGMYQELYDRLLGQGAKNIISIHASSLLSGIFGAASAAAQAFDSQVHVIDSGMVTLGLGYQVLSAAQAALQGASLETIVPLVESVRHRARVVAMLDTLDYVRRSGRVSWARARIGSLLNLKPFVEVRSGQVLSLGETRTRSKGIERLRQLLINLGPLERLAILHTNAEADARQFLASLEMEFSEAPLVVNITTVIGTHTGPRGLGFAAVLHS
ncbi:MAG: degV family protein [Chloroflexi bacterium]|jgi:DegV family protein with EDD domain|nr:degV family protein [Chloroflexota bacterium]